MPRQLRRRAHVPTLVPTVTAAHCESCDTYGCPGFTTPRAVEPPPALRPAHPVTDEARKRYIAIARAGIAAAKEKKR